MASSRDPTRARATWKARPRRPSTMRSKAPASPFFTASMSRVASSLPTLIPALVERGPPYSGRRESFTGLFPFLRLFGGEREIEDLHRRATGGSRGAESFGGELEVTRAGLTPRRVDERALERGVDGRGRPFAVEAELGVHLAAREQV